MRSLRRLAATAALAALVVTCATGCGSDSDPAAAATQATPVERDLAGYDAFVLASAENNPLFADVYGIRFAPFVVDRITTDKRVSSLGADQTHVMVAAADTDVDRLAQVTGAGALEPVPGLGRPFAYTPTLRDGVMYFDDAQGEKTKGEYRYFAWDLRTQKKTLMFQSVKDLGSAQPLGGGRFLVSSDDKRGLDQLAIRAKSGKLTEYPLNGEVSDQSPGSRYLAATLAGAGDQFGSKPEALVLVDSKTGKTTRTPGLQLICWNPDGTRLLARRTTGPTDSQLVLVDPAKPNAAVDVANVPGLTIYSGAWVRGDVPAAG